MHRILVVDDSMKSRNLIRQSLAPDGYHILCTGTVKEASRELSLEKYDLLILDINMPEVDGFSFLTTIRGKRSFQNLQVIMVSGRSDQNDVEKAVGLNVVGYIVKPFVPRQLADKVRKVLNTPITQSSVAPKPSPMLTCTYPIEIVDTSELGVIVNSVIPFQENQKIRVTSTLEEYSCQDKLLQVLSCHKEGNKYLITLFFAEIIMPDETVLTWNLGRNT